MTTVLLVGAGAVGGRAARQLSDTPGVDRILVVDRREGAAATAAKAIGGPAEPATWQPGLPLPAGVDVIACAVPGGEDVPVARDAIAAGVPCVSAADDTVGLEAMLALDGAATLAGTCVVTGAALAPGLSDVLVRHAADALDVLDEVHVARAGVAGPACEATVRKALSDRAVEIHLGERVDVRRRTGHELVWFPDPVGPQECRLVDIGVDLLARAFPGTPRITARAAEPERRRPRAWLRRGDPDGEFAAIRVEAWGRRARAVEPIVYGVIEHTSVAAGTVLAVSALALADVLDGPVTTEPGVHGLAEVASPIPFLGELARRGVKAAAFEGVAVG